MLQFDQINAQNPWWIKDNYLPEENLWPIRNIFSVIYKDISKNLIQLITGLRRVGKSTLLKQIIAHLLKNNVDPEHILYFSFDKYTIDKSPDALDSLIEIYLSRRLKKRIFEITSRVYLFIDEIQYIDFWQDILKKYYDLNKNLKFIISGSQSTKLKGKSKESLAGRVIEYNVLILSLDEYFLISGTNLKHKTIWDFQLTSEGFNDLYDFNYENRLKIEPLLPLYLCYGQFPEILQYPEDIIFGYEYIKESILGKILEIDIPKYYGIEKIQIFKNMVYHLITNSSSLYELQNIGRELGLSKTTVEKYLLYIKDSYIIDVLYKYNKSNIKKGRVLKKAYATSTNFITAVNNYQLNYFNDLPEVFGKIIETYIYHRLFSIFNNIYLWRQGNKEIDFIIPDHFNSTKTLPVEVKFKDNIRYNEIKEIITYSINKGIQIVLIITKSRLEMQNISGITTFFIPFYLI